jgi:hypothetical protein
LRVALFIHPNFPDALHLMGSIYFAFKRYELAIAHYQSALKLRVKFDKANADLGDALVATGRFSEAITEYRTALALTGKTCTSGEEHAMKNELLAAIPEFRQALGLATALAMPCQDGKTRFLTKTLTGHDMREHARFAVKLPVAIECHGQHPFMAETVDISKKGLLIECDEEITEGTEVKVLLSPPFSTDQIPIVGRVVRIDNQDAMNDRRFGIQLSAENSPQSPWETFFSEFSLI